MHSVLLLGCGKIGQAIATLLAASRDYRVLAADTDRRALERLDSAGNLDTLLLDAADADKLSSACRGCAAVISALSHRFNALAAQAALDAGASYFDLTEDVQTARLVRQLAARAAPGQIFMPQCGLAPGFISILAFHLARSFETLESVHLRVGALPQFPSNAMKYNLTWSTDGLINEYCNPCEAIHEGRRLEVLPLEGVELFSLDGVEYEAFNTSGGLGTLCDTLEGRVQDLNYRTIRYVGHRDLAAFLVNDLRLGRRRNVLKNILEHAIPVTLQDVVVIFCTATGRQKGLLVQQCDARKIYPAAVEGRSWTAIQITTAAGVCAVVDLHMAGKLPPTGFVRQEDVDYALFMENRYGRYYRADGPESGAESSPKGEVGPTSRPLPEILDRLRVPPERAALAIGSRWFPATGPPLCKRSPIDGSELASFPAARPEDVAPVVEAAGEAFKAWRMVPAPRRGELVRRIGQELRERKRDLAAVVSWEAGKITQEALGEVQEMIDICDYAVGLSRQLYGLTIASERPRHRLAEQWHPLGPVGVITAFNFPVAVWAWNAMIGLVCGDAIVWKPSEKAPLSAMACQALAAGVADQMPDVPVGVVNLVIGAGPDAGQALASSRGLPLVAATGSVPMGRAVAQTVAARLGRSLLELGGNNGMIVAPSADLDLAVRSIVFAAVGTAGQRCTTLRRLIVHESIAGRLLERLLDVYRRLPIGNPLDDGILVGPLIDERAGRLMDEALRLAGQQGGKVHGGGRLTGGVPSGGTYVKPAIVEIAAEAPIVAEETFAPILYFMRYRTLDEAIAVHNCVPQGLSSAIFTQDIREAELFCSPLGSDCGLVNVNIGTSGAEIGGAFGGEKDTGGGRQSGSDSWKAYMRRVTNTINYSTDLPLAQGIRFNV